MEYILASIITIIIIYGCFSSWINKPINKAQEQSNMWNEWVVRDKKDKDKDKDKEEENNS